MLRCNLSVLLAERNIKITKLSKDTGISRTTLTALSSNHSQGIQFDTLNTICNYLAVSPNDLLEYIPFNVKIESDRIHSKQKSTDYYDGTIEILDKNKSFVFPIYFHVSMDSYQISIDVLFDEEKITENADIQTNLLKSYFAKLPVTFLHDLESDIVNAIEDESGTDDRIYTLNWDFL